MAEFIERHMESMTEEIEEMRRLKLYTVNETKAMLKKRNYYECKINGPVKNMEDFKDYIRFEKDLLRDIKLRRNKMRIADRRGSIEIRIIKRVKHLYEIAIQRFCNNFNLTLAYFKFCQESNYTQAASLVIQNMIKNFGHIPEVWQVAAGWHIKRDIKQALSVIYKGLIIHPSSEALYIEAIQLELLTRKNNDWSDNSQAQNRDEICSKKIETYVNTIFENVKNYNCLINVLNILDNHSFTQNIKEKIIEKLINQYCNEEQVWQILADREKNGHHYPLPEGTTSSTKFRLTRCLEKYEEGISKICPEKKSVLFTMYLDFLIDLYQQKGLSNNLIQSTLITKLNQARESSILTERYYIIWAKLLTDESEILQIIEDGLKVLPESIELWKLKVKCMVMKDDESGIHKVFKMGHFALKEKSGPLWLLIIRYHLLSSSDQKIETVYKDAIEQHQDISNLIKPNYLDWVAFHKDIESAREVYKDLSVKHPFSKDLHSKMAKLEMTELNINVKELERPLKLACEQFGNNDADVWINLRDCYYQHHQLFEEAYPTFDINIKTAQIRKEAEEALKDNVIMLADFRNKYDMPVDLNM